MFRKLSVGLVALFGLGLSSAEAASQNVVCNTENVSPLGGFNTGATCVSPLLTATGGGYQLTSAATGDLLGMTVNESMPNLSGGTHGWQVIGNNTTTIPGRIRVCVLCR